MNVFITLLQKVRYHVFLVVIRLIRTLPYPSVLALFRFLALLAWIVDPFHRRIARTQIHAALDVPNVDRLVMKVFMNEGELLVDSVRYAFLSDSEIRERIVVEGKEHLDEALASGRGLMIFTGHIGNWEILSHVPRILGTRFCVMADKRNDPLLESIVDEIRSRSGATILPPTGKARMLIRELKKGRTIGMVVDKRGKPKGGLYCTVFGMPAVTNPAPAFIAIRGNALVLPVYVVKRNKAYHICFSRAVDAAGFGEGKEGIQALSDFMQSWVASVVRQYPDQWFWLYSRWLTRPDMRRVLRQGLDFREYVSQKAAGG